MDEEHEGYKRFRLQQRSLRWQAEGTAAAAEARAADPAELSASELAEVRSCSMARGHCNALKRLAGRLLLMNRTQCCDTLPAVQLASHRYDSVATAITPLQFAERLTAQSISWYELSQSVDALRTDQVLSCMQLTVYRCRQCRRLLTTVRNSIDVQQGCGQAAFAFRKRDTRAASSQLTGAGAMFVEPMQWMGELHQIAGKLYCPKCALVLCSGRQVQAWCAIMCTCHA